MRKKYMSSCSSLYSSDADGWMSGVHVNFLPWHVEPHSSVNKQLRLFDTPLYSQFVVFGPTHVTLGGAVHMLLQALLLFNLLDPITIF